MLSKETAERKCAADTKRVELRQRASDQKSDAGSPGVVFSGDVLGAKTDDNDLMPAAANPCASTDT